MRALVCELSVPRQVVTSLLGRIDKRFFFGPFSPATLRELPEPELPAPDWVTIRTRLAGIGGSDYKQMFLNGSMDTPMTAVISFPQVLGHEVVGTIERVGPAVRTRRVGERVVLNPWLSCAPRGIQPPCPECAAGQYSICRNFARGILPPGIHTGNSSKATGGFAPLVPAHESMGIPIPEGVSDEQAVLADPFSVSLHGILKRPPAPGAAGLVYCCGTLALPAIRILRAPYPATRAPAARRRWEGRPLYYKELSLIGSTAFGVEEFEGRCRHSMEIYLDLVASKRIDVTPILTHRFTLEEWRAAFLACGEQGRSGAVKVLFEYPG